jgi:putative hydrolase of HD superfamily
MDPDDVSDAELDALLSALALKDERRTGWQLRGIDAPETVAGHTWGVAYLCLLYADRVGVDPDRALRLAVLHDLAEAETGDEPTRADPGADQPDPEAKERRERAAVRELLEPFAGVRTDGESLRDAWEAYEAREDAAAQFVKDMDLIDMCLQALYYEREERYDPAADQPAFEAYDRLDEFFATAEPRLRTDVGRALYDAVHGRYERVKTRR